MPIGLEQWRAQIGLLYASRMPRAVVASKGRKYRRMKWSSLLSFCLVLVDILLRTISDAVDTRQQVSRKAISWWKAQLSSSGVSRSLPNHSKGGRKGLSLLLVCLMVVQMLLIMSGDVEENPGPLTRQETRLEDSDLLMVQNELVNVTGTWYNIGLGLGFHPGKLDEIRQLRSDPSSCLQEVLDRWLKTVNPPPTWEGLSKALEREIVGEYRLAQQLREKYCEPQQTEHDDQGSDSCTSASAHHNGLQVDTSECMKGSPSLKSQLADCPIKQQLPQPVSVDTEFENLAKRPKGQQADPCTKDTEIAARASPLVSSLVLRRGESLDGEISELQETFLDLVCTTADALKDVNLFRLKVYITQLSVSTSKYLHVKVVAGSASAINNAQSVIEIFTIIRTYRYWNFLNCGVLEKIVKKFGSGDDRRNMKAYLEKLEIFCRHTKVRDFVNWACAGLQPHHYTDLTTTMEDKWMDRSLEELQRFQLGLSRHLLIDNYTLPIKNVEPGSLILFLSIHRSFPVNELVLLCQSETTRHFLRRHGVLRMELKGVYVFDLESPQQQLETVKTANKTLLTDSEQLHVLQRENAELKATLKQKELEALLQQLDTQEKQSKATNEALLKQAMDNQMELQQREEELQQKDKQLQVLQKEIKNLEASFNQNNKQLEFEQFCREDHQQRVKELEQQLQTTRATNRDLQQQLQSCNDQLQASNAAVQEKDQVIEARERHLQELNQQLQANKEVTAEFQQNLLQKERMVRNLKEGLAAKDREMREPEQRQSGRRTGGESIQLTWREGRTITGMYDMFRGAAAVEDSVAYFKPDVSNDVHAYDSEKEEWFQLPDCPNSDFSLVVVKGMVTAVGGYDSAGEVTNSLLSLTGQRENRKWVECFPPMPTKRILTAAAHDGKILIIAGGAEDYEDDEASGKSSTVEMMDTENLQWYTAASLPYPVDEATATICGDKVYLLGGHDQGYGATKSVLTCSLTALLLSCQPQSLGARYEEL